MQIEYELGEQADREPKHEIKLTANVQQQHAEVNYEITGDHASVDLNVALVSRRMSKKATRGENAGRLLTHANVVRVFETIKLKQASGATKLAIPQSDNLHHVIAYVQNPRTAEITGAAEAKLGS